MLQVIKRKRIWPRVLVAAVVVAGGLWWWHHHREAASGEADGKGGASWSLWPSQMPNAAPTLGTAPTPGAMPPENVRPVPSPLDTMEEPVFRADNKGDLILDTQTKNDLERVYALYQGDEAQRKLTQFSSRIPEKARRQLRDLFQKYGQYAQALAQAVPPAQDDVSLEEAGKQLDTIDGLQKAYFGDDADRLFGPEMKQKKDMVHDMTDMSTQHPGMSVQDLAGLAQQHQNAQPDPKPSGQPPHSAGNGGLGNSVGAGGASAKQSPSKGPGG